MRTLKNLQDIFEDATAETWHQHANGGGWVQNTATVADTVTVSSRAIVCGNAKVSDTVQVSGYALVGGNAHVYGNAQISGNAEISDNAMVYGNAQIYGNSFIYGDARVFGDSVIYGFARVKVEVFDKARIYEKAKVYGNAKVFGNARISGNAEVYRNTLVSGDAVISGNPEAIKHIKATNAVEVIPDTELPNDSEVSDTVRPERVECGINLPSCWLLRWLFPMRYTAVGKTSKRTEAPIMKNEMFTKFLSIFSRISLWVLVIAGPLLIVASIFLARIQKPVYESTAWILVSSDRMRVNTSGASEYTMSVDELVNLAKSRSLVGQVEVLKSPDMQYDVINKLGYDNMRKGFGEEYAWQGALFPDWAITIDNPKDSDLVSINTKAYDPQIAADISNTIVRTYLERDRGYTVQATRQGRQYIEQLLKKVSKQYRESQENHYRYKRSRLIPQSELADIDKQNLADIYKTLSRKHSALKFAEESTIPGALFIANAWAPTSPIKNRSADLQYVYMKAFGIVMLISGVLGLAIQKRRRRSQG